MNKYLRPACRFGFTLAEVVITLTVIGVVAALTIPIVLTNTQERQLVTGAQKAFNTIKTAQRATTQTQGDVTGWDKEDFEKFLKNFSTIKDCGTSGTGCFSDTSLLGTGGRTFVTGDGMLWGYNTSKKLMFVDVNGLKKPNKVGLDIFVFEFRDQITDSSRQATAPGFVPFGHGLSSSKIDEECVKSGYACTAKVLSEGVMKYKLAN